MKSLVIKLTATLFRATVLATASMNLLAASVLAQSQTDMSVDAFIEALTPESQSSQLTRSLGNKGRGLASLSDGAPSIDLAVEFEFGSARLTEDAEVLLLRLAEAIRSNKLKAYSFKIAGHTDAVGSEEINFDLSMRRARSVVAFIVEYGEVDPERLIAEAFGESQLLLPDNPNSPRNRRVEVTTLSGF